MKLSLIMITKNEAHNLRPCFESVKGVVDEIIVVDDASSDDTVKIAESYGAKVYQRKFDNFTLQKGYALSLATGDWVLNMDGDEELSAGLKRELREVIETTTKNGFDVPNDNEFLGREMKHSGLKGELKFRLAKRSVAYYSGGKVHEELTTPEPCGVLKCAIIHKPYPTIESYFVKFNKYTTLAAESMFEAGKKFHYIHLIRPPFDFFKLYILNLGFLDGVEGFLWAYFSAQYPLVKYSKLWHLHKQNKKK